MKYRLADLNNGPFGDVYDTLQEAEAALAQEIAAGQAINDEYAQECADAGRDVPQSSDFFSIVEVMTALDLYEAAFDSANDYAEETAEYVQQYAEGAFEKFVDIDVCEKIAACRRAYKGIDSKGGEYEHAYHTQVRKALEDIEL